MNKSNKSEIIIKKLKRFQLDEGDVFHALKASESEYKGFQEAYFSTIKNNKIKAWKRHYKMSMNLIVPIGKVQFIFYDDDRNLLKNLIIGEENYSRITVPPMIWFGFKGLSSNTSYILNISNEIHDTSEFERRPLSFLEFTN